MRLKEIKLAGFKSFVDPTTISTPGQRVGIVGPNGCGKSNVIDAVRWVLGESRASALRGESMQDVIFNGAGDRKPVGRASVELAFDNTDGRVGGQWGAYSELAIKRVLTRDAESSYYINNIPVRRRDIHDLFLGTGLGPRAYAIIEQGMISRVIEAKPEELRVFLEEAAGVSRYKERRKETEGRLSDTRENLSRVEDIRIELGSQLERLEQQAKVAAEYRELDARLKTSQHLAWFAKQQEAMRARDRARNDLAEAVTALESMQADLRASEAALETMRRDHYAAGDALHEKQGAFYAANSEVSRLEQQLNFARDSESRIREQVAALDEQLAALGGAVGRARRRARGARARARRRRDARERTAADAEAAQQALPALEAALAEAGAALDAINKLIAEAGENLRVDESRREGAAKQLAQLDARRARIAEERAALASPADDPLRVVAEQLEQEQADLAGRQTNLETRAVGVAGLAGERARRHRALAAGGPHAGRARSARAGARRAAGEGRPRQGQGRLAREERARTREAAVDRARRRARLERRARVGAARAAGRRRGRFARRRRSAGPTTTRCPRCGSRSTRRPTRATAPTPAATRCSPACASSVPRSARLVADALHGVRCRDTLVQALADRGALGAGESFVTPAGHVVGAQSVTLFRPDGELHGVLARQRELDELAAALPGAREAAAAARATLDEAEREQTSRQQAWHLEAQALASQQRRCHDLELELVQLRQAEEAKAQRRDALARDDEELAAAVARETAAHEAIARAIADLQSALHDRYTERERARGARNEREVALVRGREALRAAERAAQEAEFAERSAADRLADLERRREALALQATQQRDMLERLSGERQAIDFSPVEEALQRQLGSRRGRRGRARRRARRARIARREAARSRGGPARPRAGARARAHADRRPEAQGTGRGAGRGAVRRAARRGRRGPGRPARRAQGLGPRLDAARRDRAAARGHRRARPGQPRRARRTRAVARAQGLPRPPRPPT